MIEKLEKTQNYSAFIHKFVFQNKLRDMEDYIGYFAAICTTVSFIPQAVKVYKTKHTKDISLVMFFMMNAGLFFWLVYGLALNSYPIIFANAFTLIFAIYILVKKIQFDVFPSKKI